MSTILLDSFHQWLNVVRFRMFSTIHNKPVLHNRDTNDFLRYQIVTWKCWCSIGSLVTVVPSTNGRNAMNRPTEKDITVTRDGYYYLDCDGRHTPSWHKYLYYTKKEVLRLWREDHPREGNN